MIPLSQALATDSAGAIIGAGGDASFRPAPAPVDVCPKCKMETSVYLSTQDGRVVEVHRCFYHGDVTPMRSAVSNSAGG